MNTQKTKWSTEDETTLLELVENYLKKGKTKNDAFITVANIINRSKAACASRYQLLRKQPKLNKITNSHSTNKHKHKHKHKHKNIDLDKVILFLFKYDNAQQLFNQNIQLKHRIQLLQKENEALCVKISNLQTSI